jgi:hypothetical protein
MDGEASEPVEYLSPSEASRHFAGNRHEKTIREWMRHGVRVKVDGGEAHLRLRHVVEGRRYFTTLLWIEEFKHTQRYWMDVENGFAVAPQQERTE